MRMDLRAGSSITKLKTTHNAFNGSILGFREHKKGERKGAEAGDSKDDKGISLDRFKDHWKYLTDQKVGAPVDGRGSGTHTRVGIAGREFRRDHLRITTESSTDCSKRDRKWLTHGIGPIPIAKDATYISTDTTKSAGALKR